MRVFSFALVAFAALFAGVIPAVAADFIGVAAALRGDVVRISTGSGDASPGPVSSGTKIFLGDEIKVASGGRMQIMLLDETVFTLGSGASLVIDEFVYDPAAETGSMTTQITKGGFPLCFRQAGQIKPESNEGQAALCQHQHPRHTSGRHCG